LQDWDKIYKNKGEVQAEVMRLVKKASSIFKKHGVSRVLDLGCGTGRHTLFLASSGFDAYGVDISEAGVAITGEKLKRAGLRATLRINDFDSLHFKGGYFDAVISTHTIHHAKIDKIRMALKEIHRVLKQDGLLVLAILSFKDPWYQMGKEIERNTRLRIGDPDEGSIPHHYFTEKELRSELKRFKILEFEHRLEWSKRRQVMSAHWEVICQKKGP
jgi:ubiquinone/menaquinone biosynthesis C-methylase UbiE